MDAPNTADPGAARDLVACPACGRDNPPGFRFCGQCGSSMERVCGNCGAASPPEFRFCGNCGRAFERATAPDAAVEPAQPPPGERGVEERKVVTMLFADLTASTELAARLDPEDLRAILRPFFQAMSEEVDRFGGTVEKFIGDAVVAVFGAPVAHEDDPERAVRAALAMQRRLAELNHRLREERGEELAMRIGVNTGEVVAAPGRDHEGLVTGEAMNVAARFQALAPPGGIVVSDRTYRDTRGVLGYRPLGEVRLKGIDRALAAWQAVGEVGGEEPRRAQAPLVGREEELAFLRLLLSRTVRERQPNLVTLFGPAGIGKSRLAQEFVSRAEVEDAAPRVVRGRCLPYGDGLTYWPLAEILKADAGILDSDPAEAIVDKARSRLEARFGAGAGATGTTQVLLSSIGVAVGADPLAGAEPDAARQIVARAWRTYFESIASERAVIAVIEDLHWADPTFLDLVEMLARRLTGPVLLLCTARPELWERRPGWGGGLRNGSTIELAPLSDDEAGSLVRALLGADVPDEVVGPVLARAEGNPFFAGELLRMLVDEGYLSRHGEVCLLERSIPTSLPDTVQGVIAARIDVLAPAEKRAVQDAAVVGRVFWRGAVQRLGSPDAGAALEALVRKGLVFERDTSALRGEPEFIFNHVLTRDVAYASIPRSRRAVAHGQAGEWLEELTRGRAEEFAEILAHHFELADDPERTAHYAMLAGHRLRRVFSAADAIRWYDRALDVATRLADTDVLVSEIALARGAASEQLGSFGDAHADYERAVEAARAAGDDALEARALAALAHVYWLEDRFDEGRRVLGDALTKVREVGARELEARLLYTAGTMAFGRGEFDDALLRHQEALRVAWAADDLEGEGLAHHGLCETRFFTGPFEEAVTEGLRADEILTRLGQRPMVHHNGYMVAWALWLRGRLEEAHEWARAAIEGSRDVGNRRDEAFALANRAVMLLGRGEVGEAVRLADEAIGQAETIDAPRLELVCRVFRMFVHGEIGDAAMLAEETATLAALSDRLGGRFLRPPVLAWRGVVALQDGDRDAALRLFREAREVERSLNHRLMSSWIQLLGVEEARDAELLRTVGTAIVDAAAGESPTYVALGRYALGLAALLDGDAGEALREGEAGRAEAQRIGLAIAAWRCGAVVAGAHAALGREEAAEAARADAVEGIRAESSSLADPRMRSAVLDRSAVAWVLAAQPVPSSDPG